MEIRSDNYFIEQHRICDRSVIEEEYKEKLELGYETDDYDGYIFSLLKGEDVKPMFEKPSLFEAHALLPVMSIASFRFIDIHTGDYVYGCIKTYMGTAELENTRLLPMIRDEFIIGLTYVIPNQNCILTSFCNTPISSGVVEIVDKPQRIYGRHTINYITYKLLKHDFWKGLQDISGISDEDLPKIQIHFSCDSTTYHFDTFNTPILTPKDFIALKKLMKFKQYLVPMIGLDLPTDVCLLNYYDRLLQRQSTRRWFEIPYAGKTFIDMDFGAVETLLELDTIHDIITNLNSISEYSIGSASREAISKCITFTKFKHSKVLGYMVDKCVSISDEEIHPVKIAPEILEKFKAENTFFDLTDITDTVEETQLTIEFETALGGGEQLSTYGTSSYLHTINVGVNALGTKEHAPRRITHTDLPSVCCTVPISRLKGGRIGRILKINDTLFLVISVDDFAYLFDTVNVPEEFKNKPTKDNFLKTPITLISKEELDNMLEQDYEDSYTYCYYVRGRFRSANLVPDMFKNLYKYTGDLGRKPMMFKGNSSGDYFDTSSNIEDIWLAHQTYLQEVLK